MSKTSSSLQSAIRDLNIKKPISSRTVPSSSEVPQNEETEIERPPHETIQGFFMLAHRIFGEARIRVLPGDCFRVFLWMSAQAYRFKNSNGTIRASASFVAAGVGIAESSVTRAFDTLIKAKLIRRAEINYKLGNLWWIDPMAFGGKENTESGPSENKGTQNKEAQNRTEATSNCQGTPLQMREPVTENGGEKKNLQDLNTENLLSSYFKELRPERKRSSEWKAYQSLRQDFSDDEILLGLDSLRKEDPRLIRYHSPMAYLSFALSQVLVQANVTPAAAEKHKANVIKQDERKNAQAEELRAWNEKEVAFVAAFPTPDDQKSAVEEFSSRAGVTLIGGETMKRGIAIGFWWDQQMRQAQREL